MTVASTTRVEVTHPLEPLTAEEIRAAVALMRESSVFEKGDRIVGMRLAEPPKGEVLSFEAGDAILREAAVVILTKTGVTREATVDLSGGTVPSVEHLPGVQPAITLQEFDDCEAACKASEAYREALRKRGVEDLERVIIDPWSAGSYGDSDATVRLARGLSWVKSADQDNGYAHPIDNVIPLVDLNSMEVIRVDDYGVVPVPGEDGNFEEGLVPSPRTDLRPIEITQPEGASFTVTDHQIEWLDWKLRIGFTPKEGLVLHTVSFKDGDRERPVLYRASLAEMVTPYGDPHESQRRKNAFDAGEYNVGMLANSLELGCDCLGEIHYFDVTVCDSAGEPQTLKNAVCLHEEDDGLLWKHFDFRTERAETRRGRRLVLSFIATVANYDYGFYWYFHQDGTIQWELKATGIVSTGALAEGEDRPYGQRLNKSGLYAPLHQHLFSVRLDMMVDGPRNSVYEVDIESEHDPELNPFGNGFRANRRLLECEDDARCDGKVTTARHWEIVNENVENAVGEPVAYRLVPGTGVERFSNPDASISSRAGFAEYALWVTGFDAKERHAAGEYPNQHPGGAGLPEYVQGNRSLKNTDVVLWHTVGSNHKVRLEDWPVMPVQRFGFKLEPTGFFNENPAVNLPSPSACH